MAGFTRRRASVTTGRAATAAAAATVATATAAAVVAMGAFAPPARADGPAGCQPGVSGPVGGAGDAGGVNLHAGGRVIWCSAQAIRDHADIPPGTDVPIAGTPGQPQSNPVQTAISVHGLLVLAGLDPAAASFLELPRLDGTWSVLSRADLADPSPSFPDGKVPLVALDGATTEYLRPLRGPDDTNGGDQIPAQGGAALEATVHTGPLLAVTVRADRTAVAAGTPVRLTATVTGAPPAAGTLSYRWTFGDAGRTAVADGATARHTYATPGSYAVFVTVSGSGDAGGSAGPLTVTVAGGAAARGATGVHGPAAGGTAAPGATPFGAVRRTSTPRRSTPPTAAADAAAHRALPAARPPAPPQPAPPTQSIQPPRPVRPVQPPRPVQPLPPSAARPQPRVGSPTPDPPVAGRLLRGPLLVAATSPVAVPAAAPPSARAASTGGAAPLGAAGGGLAVALLAGLGAGAEIRGRRRALTEA